MLLLMLLVLGLLALTLTKTSCTCCWHNLHFAWALSRTAFPFRKWPDPRIKPSQLDVQHQGIYWPRYWAVGGAKWPSMTWVTCWVWHVSHFWMSFGILWYAFSKQVLGHIASDMPLCHTGKSELRLNCIYNRTPTTGHGEAVPVYLKMPSKILSLKSATIWSIAYAAPSGNRNLTIKIFERMLYMILFMTSRNSESRIVKSNMHIIFVPKFADWSSYPVFAHPLQRHCSTAPLYQRLWASSSLTALAEHRRNQPQRTTAQKLISHGNLCQVLWKSLAKWQSGSWFSGGDWEFMVSLASNLYSHPHWSDMGDVEFVKLHYVMSGMPGILLYICILYNLIMIYNTVLMYVCV